VSRLVGNGLVGNGLVGNALVGNGFVGNGLVSVVIVGYWDLAPMMHRCYVHAQVTT
jgi:hypothetical protein